MDVKNMIKNRAGRAKRKYRQLVRSIANICLVACGRSIMFQGKWPWLLKVPGYLQLIKFIYDLARILYHLPGINVWRVSNSRWSAVFAGSKEGLAYFRHLLCEADDVTEPIETISLVKIPGRSRHWLADGADLVAVEASPLLNRFLSAPIKFVVPTWIEMVLPFAEPLDCMIAGTKKQSLRNVINKFRRDGYSFVYGRQEEDFKTFYTRMYHPFIIHKHAGLASLITYETMFRMWRDRGGILFIEKDGQKVAGALCFVHDRCCIGVILGILESAETLYHKGILSFINWCTILWSHAQGALSLNMGETRPCAAEGAYPYKVKWGAQAFCARKGGFDFFFMASDLKPCLQNRINRQKLICKHNGDLHALIVQGSSENVADAEVQERLAQIENEGLAGLCIASAGASDNILRNLGQRNVRN